MRTTLALVLALVLGALPAAAEDPAEPEMTLSDDELARLPDDAAREAAQALVRAVNHDDVDLFMSLAPKTGIRFLKKKKSLKALARALEVGVKGLLRLEEVSGGGSWGTVPWPLTASGKKKQFAIFQGSGYGDHRLVILDRRKEGWRIVEVRDVDLGPP